MISINNQIIIMKTHIAHNNILIKNYTVKKHQNNIKITLQILHF